MNKIITRFAPSPTGPLHLGSVRTALINYIVTIQAKKVNEESKFILRIEDTDKERSKDEYITNIINSLKWLNIDWDNEIVIQSKNVLRHIEIANELINKKGAYKCICSSEKIEEIRKKRLKEKMSIKRLCETCQNDSSIQNLKENYCVRIKIPNDGSIKINDLIQGEVSIQNKEIDNFILLKKDNSPTYMLSSVVDDYDSKINTVIRGNDHFNNAFRQYYIYKYLNWKFPFYAHLPLVHGLDGSKLSKRHGSVNVYDFKDNGYLPKALINNLILLGWSPNNNSEIIEMDEIIKKFDIKKISKSSSIFNYKKLDFFNNYYLKKYFDIDLIKNFYENNYENKIDFKLNHLKIKNIFEIHKEKINTIHDFVKIINIYFDTNFTTLPNKILDIKFDKYLQKFKDELNKLNNWDESNLNYLLNNFINKEKIKFGNFAKPLRQLLTNEKDGISINSLIYLLGKEVTISRISNYLIK